MKTLPSLICTVNDVNLTEGRATVNDSYGKARIVRMDIRKGGGPYPRPGDLWIISHENGQWGFDSLVRGNTPVVTGAKGGNVALGNLLSVLESMGLIDDQTT